MKIFNVMIAICFTLLSLSVPSISALDLNGEYMGEKPEWMPDISVETAFLTKYIWRGQNLVNAPVMQPGISLSKYGITASIWGNYDTGDNDSFTELDYTARYTFGVGETLQKMGMSKTNALDPLNISAGYTYYTFPNQDWDSEAFDSHEVYLGASYSTFLNPSFTWYWDVDAGSGAYLVAGISHTFEFYGGISADIGMTAAYNYKQWTTESGWSDMVFSGGVNIPVFHYFTVTPEVSYSLILDRDTYSDAQGNEFYGGVKLSFAY